MTRTHIFMRLIFFEGVPDNADELVQEALQPCWLDLDMTTYRPVRYDQANIFAAELFAHGERKRSLVDKIRRALHKLTLHVHLETYTVFYDKAKEREIAEARRK